MKNSENNSLQLKAINIIQSLFNEFGDTKFNDKNYEKLVNDKWMIDFIIKCTINGKKYKFLVKTNKTSKQFSNVKCLTAQFNALIGTRSVKQIGINF